jgi:hypothetical protein
VREWSNTISYMKRCNRTDCWVKDRDSRLNSKRKWNKKQAWHGAEREKTIQSVNVAAVHELDDVSSDKDTSQQSQQTGSTFGNSISSQASNSTGV